jgi:hypothetical protein
MLPSYLQNPLIKAAVQLVRAKRALLLWRYKGTEAYGGFHGSPFCFPSTQNLQPLAASMPSSSPGVSLPSCPSHLSSVLARGTSITP